MSLEPIEFQFQSRLGKEVLLRAPKLEDAEAITEALQDQSIFTYMCNIPNPYTLEDALVYIEFSNAVQKNGKICNFAICIENKPCGMSGLTFPNGKDAEYGYWLNIQYRNQGIVSEATKRIINHGFTVLNLDSVTIRILDGNLPSVQIMKKLGIPQLKTVKEEEFYRNRKWDVIYFKITKDNFIEVKKNW